MSEEATPQTGADAKPRHFTPNVQLSAYGRLTRDPEAKTSERGHPYTRARIACNVTPAKHEGEQQTWFVDVIAFRSQAAALAKCRQGPRRQRHGSPQHGGKDQRRPHLSELHRDGRRRDGRGHDETHGMTEPPEPQVAPTTIICAIPTAPVSTDKESLRQVYDNQAQYLGTVRHRPTHIELAQMAVLHGFRPALPVSAIQWTNRYAQRVILLVAVPAAPQFQGCDHGRSSVLGRRPFRGPLRAPAVAAAHQHYTELRRCLHCHAVQMVNVGATGAREASPWFEPDGDAVTWSGLYAAALAAGAPDSPASA